MFDLVFESHDGRALVPTVETHEPVSDIDTVVVNSLKALDPNGLLEKRTLAMAGAMSVKCPSPDIGSRFI